jgi:hypothetical protein
MEDIDIVRTKNENRLIYKTHWVEFYEIFFFVVILYMFIIPLILTFNSTKDLKAIVILSLMLLILIGIAIYKMKKSRQLHIIDTGQSLESNKLLIYDFIDKCGYKLKYDNYNYLRAITKFNFLDTQKELTVLFDDNKVLINIVTKGYIRFPMPLELNKFIKELNKKINAGT